MSQIDLFLDIPSKETNILSNNQKQALKQIKLPKVVKFLLADKFDDKFLVVSDKVWTIYYSGKTERLKFSIFEEDITTLLKFFLISFIQKNTPSGLANKFYSFVFLMKFLQERKYLFNYESLKAFLIEISDQKEYEGCYSHIKFLLRLLIIESFPGFEIEDDFELGIIPRPKAFNSHLFYQEYEDVIDYPTITMIQQGFAKLNAQLKNHSEQIDNKTLLNASILGLIYASGLRPVQLAKLAAEDIRLDSTREIDQFNRYSILIPYAKQGRFRHEKIAVKLPEEIAEVILTYIKRFQLTTESKLFEMGENSARFCSNAINTQLFDFAPPDYQQAVLAGEMIQEKYSFSDFRHHVGYSLAMAGASAEEIAYILGHSSVVTARYYIFSTPELAQIRAQALGRNSLYQQMIAMMLTGRLTHKKDWPLKKVVGNIGDKVHHNIGGCSYQNKCLFQPVRNCYGCIYFHPFIEGEHIEVLNSVQNEINELIKLSDGIGISRNPLIRIHESTKFEVESVINRCSLYTGNKNE
ncbi:MULTISPECIES: site-specific integrase [Acinetobacter calcoaceticus/baumannii complex]|uniref:site-specific integrase n=1 Tax=Acinetobacter calcoaceticus/baumannii complex TaxID=909768 RepID=UPI00244935B8|nr:site-specific integrase [Acinetobacter baumannii]MDH2518617.1 site-specific integrase [Acinetobacter baumannii]